MHLTEICDMFSEANLVRDAEFATMGFINQSKQNRKMVFLKDEKFLQSLIDNKEISAVITFSEYADQIIEHTNYGVIVTKNPERLFYIIHNQLCNETEFYKKGNKPTIIGENCQISPNAVIAEKNVVIGSHVIIEPGAVIMEGVTIGNNCVIGANTSIGTRGFQYYRNEDECFYIEHVGGVIIEDNVEILSGVCVACGLLNPTYICKNTKIDNLVHIGHSAYLDQRVLVTAGAVIGGSVHVGKRVWIGINSVICASVHIGDDAFICMGAVVTRNVETGQKVSGNFAVDHKIQVEFMKEICKRG